MDLVGRAHPRALTDHATWDKAQTTGAERGNIRDAEKPTTQPGTRYALRSRIRHQACQRRMYGTRRPSSSKTSPGTVYTYYHCPYNPSNPRHAAAHPDHPATSVSIRHKTIMAAITRFLDQWVFGHDRAAMLADLIPAASAEQAAARQRQHDRLTAELARIATPQAGLLTELERLGADTSPPPSNTGSASRPGTPTCTTSTPAPRPSLMTWPPPPPRTRILPCSTNCPTWPASSTPPLPTWSKPSSVPWTSRSSTGPNKTRPPSGPSSPRPPPPPSPPCSPTPA
ncbi:MAG TPA: hypothetical protein VGL49_03580 [Acidimicrobiales bacterium]